MSAEVDLQKLCQDRPEEVIAALLDAEFFPAAIKTDIGYQRYGDDTCLGSITVGFLQDGDGLVEIDSQLDPDELTLIHRFRTFFGGGQSDRVRKALLILALAIQMDNDERPQLRDELLKNACTCPQPCVVHRKR